MSTITRSTQLPRFDAAMSSALNDKDPDELFTAIELAHLMDFRVSDNGTQTAAVMRQRVEEMGVPRVAARHRYGSYRVSDIKHALKQGGMTQVQARRVLNQTGETDAQR